MRKTPEPQPPVHPARRSSGPGDPRLRCAAVGLQRQREARDAERRRRQLQQPTRRVHDPTLSSGGAPRALRGRWRHSGDHLCHSPDHPRGLEPSHQPSAPGRLTDASDDRDNFKVEVLDATATGNTIPANKVEVEALKRDHSAFSPRRKINVELQRVGTSQLFRSNISARGR